ncbi:exosome 3'-_5 exonuclease subunit ski4 (Csl4) [Kalmusia sp. IMI 367209]|nr:exosome 3'->5 exonuclease subunit ski4 (Csl4) [Kalmusia sp. IMI 367209]
MALPSLALPGTLLGPTSKYAPGPGTHIHDSSVYASIAGSVIFTASSKSTATKLPLLSISHPGAESSSNLPGSGSANILPEVGATVLARITRLGTRFCTASILCIPPYVLPSSFAAQIRREDIRATEKDKVTIQDSFRVGDIVRAEVISLGDNGGYYLSTGRNELGVVVAWGEGGEVGGEVLVPVSWKEVRDLRAGKGEGRKVAKPF